MRRLYTQFVLASFGLACLALTSTPLAGAEDDVAAAPQFALLVGVSEYAHLEPRDQLEGCAGDVELMRLLLADRYGFAVENIVTLTGAAATGNGIRGEMAALAERVAALPADSPPAQVVFHFSGHGSQMPDQEVGDPDCDEVDGLDETLVPADATAQGGAQDIRDDELYAFLEEIAGEGRAHVWVVLDCCHSGSGARGATKFRRLNRGLTFLPPAEQADRIVQEKRLPPGVVVLSACAASEVEPEYVEGEKHYGLLTHFLVSAVQTRPELNDFTYADLHATLAFRYTTEAALLQPPSPQLEGDAEAMAGIVLAGGNASIVKHRIPVDIEADEPMIVTLQAGTLQNVAIGDIYQVRFHIDWDEEGHKPLDLDFMQVVVTEVAANEARAERVAWSVEEPAIDSRGGPPRPRTVEFYAERASRAPRPFDQQVHIQVLRQETPDDPAEILVPGGAAPLGIYLGLLNATSEGGQEPAIWVGAEEPCDYILRIVGETGALFPATGLMYPPAPAENEEGEPAEEPPSDIPAALVGGWGPIDLSTDAGGEQLSDYLQRIAQAQNVLRMAAEQQEQMAGERLAVELELVSIEWDGEQVTGSTPWPADAEGQMLMHEGDTYALRVTNNSRLNDPIYITILRVDPNLGIDVALPYQVAQGVVPEQELAPGESRTCSPYRCGNDYGLRWAIVLASSEPQSFTSLAQQGLPVIRGEREEIPLDDSWTAATLRWVVAPPVAP